MIIAKCWNTLREFVGDETFVEHSDAIEQEMLPLYELMQDPSGIDFDEDILLFVMTSIKHTRRVSAVQWHLLPHLANFYRKYRTTFGMLLRVYSYFTVFGAEELKAMPLEESSPLSHLLHVSVEVLVDQKSKEQCLTNAEGALMISLLLKWIKVNPDKGITLPSLGMLLDNTFGRMTNQPLTDFLKRALINTVMSAFEASPAMTATYLEEKGLSTDFMVTAESVVGMFKFPEERKLFVRGLLAIMECGSLPPSFVTNHTRTVLELTVIALQA